MGSLYFDKLFPAGVEALVGSVRLVRDGSAPRVVQDESQATYEPPTDDANSAIDWSRPAREVYNLIRGSNPQPGAHAMLGGVQIRIFDARLSDDTAAERRAGEIAATSDAGITVALDGGTLQIERLHRAGGKKQPAAEFAREAAIQPGARFENGATVHR